MLVVRGGSSDNACWWSSTDGNDPRAKETNLEIRVAECVSQTRTVLLQPLMLRVEPSNLRLWWFSLEAMMSSSRGGVAG